MAPENDWLKANFSVIWPAHMEAFVPLMITLRREFGGDFEQMVILAVIGERKLARRACLGEPRFDTFGRTEIVEGAGTSINAYSLAAYTGIPRETVRRKVAALIERGWVVRDASGNLNPTEAAARDLADATEATLTYLRKLFDALEVARASGPQPTRST